MLLISALIGVFVGVLSGMLGIGGGMAMIPIFRLGYGMQAIQATATSLFAIVPTSAAGLVTHIRNKTCYPKLGVMAGVGGALTSVLGVRLANMSPSWLVMLAAALVIGYSSVTMFRKAMAVPKSGGKESGKAASERAAADSDKASEAPLSQGKLLGGAAIGLVAGVASGYVGVGGGFIMIPMFISMLGTSMKKASGTSLIAICILAVPGVVSQLLLGNVVVAAGAAMAAGAIPGAILGANLTRYVPERQLRFVFAILLVFAAIMLVVNELPI